MKFETLLEKKEIERNYLDEAFRIAVGRTLVLPEKAHILALVKLLEEKGLKIAFTDKPSGYSGNEKTGLWYQIHD